MRLIALFLLAANLVFFAVHQGYLGAILPDAREPQRLAQQIQPERMRLQGLAEGAASKVETKAETDVETKAVPATATAPEAPSPDSSLAACVEYGGFTVDESKVALSTLTGLLPGAKIDSRNSNEPTGYTVYLPPYKTRDEAVAAVEELKQLGIKDYFIIEDNSPLRLGISLASLKTEDQAKAQLALLTKKGVKNAQIYARNNPRVWLQIRAGTTTNVTEKIAGLKSKYPNQETRACVVDKA